MSDPTAKLTDGQIREFNLRLAAEVSSPLIQEAVRRANENPNGPILLTPPQLQNFINPQDRYYEAYRDYAVAFDRLLQKKPIPLSFSRLDHGEVNKSIGTYFYNLPKGAGKILLFTCFVRKEDERADFYDKVEYPNFRKISADHISFPQAYCPDGDPETTAISLSFEQYPIKLEIDRLNQVIKKNEGDLSQAKNDLPLLQLLNKRGVYSDLDQVKLIEDQLQKRFGTSASLQLGYFGTRYGIPFKREERRFQDYREFLSILDHYTPRKDREKFEEDKKFLGEKLGEIALAEIRIDEKIKDIIQENDNYGYLNRDNLPDYKKGDETITPDSQETASSAIRYLEREKVRLEGELQKDRRELKGLSDRYKKLKE